MNTTTTIPTNALSAAANTLFARPAIRLGGRQAGAGRRTGAVMVYAMTVLIVMLALGTVAVDWGHVQLAKTQLSGAADAAARAGAAALANSPAAAVDAARWTAAQNVVDGTALSVAAADVQIGSWNGSTFTRLYGSDQYSANAVKVVAKRDAASRSAIPNTWGSVFGVTSTNLKVEPIAMLVRGLNVDQPVAAVSNPFLAGASAGTGASRVNPHDNPDAAGTKKNPKQSPDTVNLPLVDGAVLTFDSIDGVARHDPGLGDYEPDGQLNDIGHNNLTRADTNSKGATYYNENGIADVRAPINALVGVFLTDADPAGSAAPDNLDFSSTESRNFQKLEPKMKQIFFIGDGLDDSGKQQQFIVPKGATRLFLATWDFYEWNNNSGTRVVKVSRPDQIVLVK
jgi:Flp pilus assembly protein TadG